MKYATAVALRKLIIKTSYQVLAAVGGVDKHRECDNYSSLGK
jgi:hypothetical protein